jgi:hypothetical protein
MMQAAAVIVILLIFKLLYDYIKEQLDKKNAGGGGVIDISNAWIDTSQMPYRRKDYLFNPKELAAFNLITDIVVNTNYIACPRVRLADLLTVAADTENRPEYLNRVKDKSLDIAIMDRGLKPYLAIKLEASSDGGKRKQLADRFMEKVLAAAGIPSITLNLNDLPAEEQLRQRLHASGLIF